MKNIIITSLLLVFAISAFAQTGIGTTTPNSSAQLEVASTTKGFLMPRMTLTQMNTIASPAEGLMVYCTDCDPKGLYYYDGIDFLSSSTALVSTPLEIGNPYQGGVIAYILQIGDPGYIAQETHGLIAATADQNVVGIQWYNGSYDVTGATGTAIGTGSTNTDAIISIQGAVETSYAAGLARAYTGGGYTDWYLPSKDELAKLYENRVLIGGFKTVFPNAHYWSSTEFDSGSAIGFTFHSTTTSSFNFSKHDSTKWIRAVRSF